MGNSDSLADPVKFRFLISTGCPPEGHRQGSPVFILVWLPLRVTPVAPEVHLSVMVVLVRIDAPVFPSLQLRGRTTELPPSDFNRQGIRFTRYTLRGKGFRLGVDVMITSCTGEYAQNVHSYRDRRTQLLHDPRTSYFLYFSCECSTPVP